MQTWGLGHEFLVPPQTRIRGAFVLWTQEVSFLNHLPYLLFRVREPGVARRCITEFDSAPQVHHHRVSRIFLGKGTVLRRELEQVQLDGSNISQLLAYELLGLEGSSTTVGCAGGSSTALQVALSLRRLQATKLYDWRLGH